MQDGQKRPILGPLPNSSPPLPTFRGENFIPDLRQYRKIIFLKECNTRSSNRHRFLSKIFQAPDEESYKKLGRVMKYLKGKIKVLLTLEADGSGCTI